MDNERLGTDGQGRAIYECVDCKATHDGAPFTLCLDKKHRCYVCVRVYDGSLTEKLKLAASEIHVPWESARNMRVADFVAQVDRQRFGKNGRS